MSDLPLRPPLPDGVYVSSTASELIEELMSDPPGAITWVVIPWDREERVEFGADWHYVHGGILMFGKGAHPEAISIGVATTMTVAFPIENLFCWYRKDHESEVFGEENDDDSDTSRGMLNMPPSARYT